MANARMDGMDRDANAYLAIAIDAADARCMEDRTGKGGTKAHNMMVGREARVMHQHHITT